MEGPLYILVTGLALVTIISLLVAAHELGHYLFARLFGMGVEEFAIGFGKRPLFTWLRRTYTIPLAPGQDPQAGTVISEGSALEGGTQRREIEVVEGPGGTVLRETTDFTVRAWPLGGFVRIKGMMPEEDGSETRIPGGFYSKPPWQRFFVLLAGPAFSVLAGILVLVPVYMFAGMERPVKEPIVGMVAPKGPAGVAGLKEGDRILSVGGKPVASFYEVLTIVRDAPGQALPFAIDRKGERLTLTVTPVLDPMPTNIVGPDMMPTPDVKRQGKIYAAWQYRRERSSFGAALSEAARQPVEIVKGLAGIVVKPARFEQQVSGPATIARVTGVAVSQGFDKVLWLAAMLSISIGIMNLLPMPPLDGGQIVVCLAEMVRRGRRLSLRVQNAAGMIGAMMVFALMIGAFAVDIKRMVQDPQREKAFQRSMESVPKPSAP